MTSLRERRRAERNFPSTTSARDNETTALSFIDWARQYAAGGHVKYGGFDYQAFKIDGAPGGDSFTSNPIVFSLEAIRILLFSEVRFQFQQMRSGKPGDLFGTQDLAILEEPWPGHTTRDLLARSELDIFSSGNSYWVRNSEGFVRLNPKHTKLMVGKAREDAITGVEIGDKLLGYAYVEDPDRVAIYTPDEVCHYKPYPDPNNQFLGVSWLSACLPDLATDSSLGSHKKSVFDNGAALSTIVSLDKDVSPEAFTAFVTKFREQHEGPDNAGKTLFLGGGADVKTVGQTFENLALQATQGAGEVRIAACAGVPPTIAGFSSALTGSSLNAGNYGEARRRLADATMRPLWGAFAGAVSSLVNVPSQSRLWYDEAGVAFLREDQGDLADILAENAKSVMTLVQAGYQPDAAVEAVVTGDLNRLKGKHTGMTSVQLLPPGDGKTPDSQTSLPATQPVGANNGH